MNPIDARTMQMTRVDSAMFLTHLGVTRSFSLAQDGRQVLGQT
jgi:hypothetical protein